jgi:acyl-coenzyme A thioesterase PaaI-like protein
MTPPPITVDPGWEPLWPFPKLSEGRSFVSGRQAADRMRVAYFRKADDDRLLARAWFGPGTEGPPAHAHGGAIAAVLDEIMGGVCWMNGHPVLAARVTINFARPIPLGTDATVEAWIDLIEGRKISTRARLLDAESLVFAEADGLFVVMKAEVLEGFDRRALPGR